MRASGGQTFKLLPSHSTAEAVRVIKIWSYLLINEVGGQVQCALHISLFFKKAGKRVKKAKTDRISINMTLFDD